MSESGGKVWNASGPAARKHALSSHQHSPPLLISQTEALALVQASNGSLAVDPDAETALLKTAVHTGDRAVYDRVKDMYLAATEAHEKLHLLRAVSVSGPAAEETLDWALGPDVRAHDLATVVGTVAAQSRDDGPDVAWRWLERRWGQVYAKLGSNTEASRKLGSIMENVASLFTNQTAIPAVQALFKAHQVMYTLIGGAVLTWVLIHVWCWQS